MAVSFLMGVAALRERLQRLLNHPQPWDRSVATWLLGEAEDGKAIMLPVLFLMAFDPDMEIAGQAVTAIVRLTSHFDQTRWHWLEARMRSYMTVIPSGLPSIMRDNLHLLARFGTRHVLLLGLASFGRNGHIREAAVKELAACSDGELPFLLMRLNDWVPQVSEAAHAACTARFTPSYAVPYLASLPFVLALSGAGRRDFSPFIHAVEELLTRPECRPALMNGLAATDPLVRRTCFRLALSLTNEDVQAVFGLAFQNSDPIVRRQAARMLRERPAGDAVQLALMPRLHLDALASIRREYLYLCQEKYPDRAAGALRNALLDLHPSVRSVARFYLPRHEPTDFRRFYLDALESSTSTNLAVALAGLGEAGRAEDAPRVINSLHHPSATVRQAAVTALGRLNGDAALPELLAALNDVRAPVSRAAREALEPRVHLVDDEALWAAYGEGTAPHAWMNALRLMLALPKWRGGALLAEACAWAGARADAARVGKVLEFLHRWLERLGLSALRPTRDQLARMQQAMGAGEAAFDPRTLARLRDVLRYSEGLVT